MIAISNVTVDLKLPLDRANRVSETAGEICQTGSKDVPSDAYYADEATYTDGAEPARKCTGVVHRT